MEERGSQMQEWTQDEHRQYSAAIESCMQPLLEMDPGSLPSSASQLALGNGQLALAPPPPPFNIKELQARLLKAINVGERALKVVEAADILPTRARESANKLEEHMMAAERSKNECAFAQKFNKSITTGKTLDDDEKTHWKQIRRHCRTASSRKLRFSVWR